MIRRLLDLAILIAVSLLSLLAFLQVDGSAPSEGLDPSWQYVVAYAAKHRWIFGQDIVFTYGPLAALNTRFFLPGEQLLYIAGSALIVFVLCAALWRVNRSSQRYVFFLLPILLAFQDLLDAFFLTMPLAIVLFAERMGERKKVDIVILIAFSATLGAWPLIKGTFTLPAAVCVVTAFLILWRKRPSLATAMAISPLISVVAIWLAMSQPLHSLPVFFQRIFAVSSGYTDALATHDYPYVTLIFPVCAIIIISVLYINHVTIRLLLITASAAVLLIVYKAFYVREHLLIGGSALIFISFYILLENFNRPTAVAMMTSLLGGFYLYNIETPVSLNSVSEKFHKIPRSALALSNTLTQNSNMRENFDATKERIANAAALPATPGRVDIYSYDQTLLLASNRNYVPRPIPQSYAAYSTSLASLNRDHLVGQLAPDTILFRPQPIDGRYPSLEDGLSWPELLSLYTFDSYYRDYLLLKRRDVTKSYTIDRPSLENSFWFGQTVDLPDVDLAWASIKIKTTFIGMLARIFGKNPSVMIDLTYYDGREVVYRFIPEMGSGGFLLSPTVSTTADFATLRYQEKAARAQNRVKSISVKKEGTWPFWRQSFEITVSALHVPPLSDSDTAGRPLEGMPLNSMVSGGYCSIDSIGGKLVTRGGIIQTPQELVTVTGWAADPDPDSPTLGGLNLVLQPAKGAHALIYTDASRYNRPDVDAALKLTQHLQNGFTAQLDLRKVHGRNDLRVAQRIGGRLVFCPNAIAIER